MAEKAPGWLGRILLPQISELKGELRAVGARVDGLEGKMDAEFKAVHSEIRRLDQRMDSFDKRMDSFDKKLDITQRLAVVESKVHELESRD